MELLNQNHNFCRCLLSLALFFENLVYSSIRELSMIQNTLASFLPYCFFFSFSSPRVLQLLNLIWEMKVCASDMDIAYLQNEKYWMQNKFKGGKLESTLLEILWLKAMRMLKRISSSMWFQKLKSSIYKNIVNLGSTVKKNDFKIFTFQIWTFMCQALNRSITYPCLGSIYSYA